MQYLKSFFCYNIANKQILDLRIWKINANIELLIYEIYEQNSARTRIFDYASGFLDLNNLALQFMQNMFPFFSFTPVFLLAFEMVIVLEILKSVSGKPFHKVNVNWIFTRLQKIQEWYYARGKALCLCRWTMNRAIWRWMKKENAKTYDYYLSDISNYLHFSLST